MYRRMQQGQCNICRLRKTSHHCSRCNRPICPPGARKTVGHKRDWDLETRDCWERHLQYGFPSRSDPPEDWRGPWWTGYEEHKRTKTAETALGIR
eukprot:COSAG04_NODE_1563_length_6327_cov_5.968690_2_plen_95_part_00